MSTGEVFDKINNIKHNEHLLSKSTKYSRRPVKRKIHIKTSDGSWCRSDRDTAEAYAEHLEKMSNHLISTT